MNGSQELLASIGEGSHSHRHSETARGTGPIGTSLWGLKRISQGEQCLKKPGSKQCDAALHITSRLPLLLID